MKFLSQGIPRRTKIVVFPSNMKINREYEEINKNYHCRNCWEKIWVKDLSNNMLYSLVRKYPVFMKHMNIYSMIHYRPTYTYTTYIQTSLHRLKMLHRVNQQTRIQYTHFTMRYVLHYCYAIYKTTTLLHSRLLASLKSRTHRIPDYLIYYFTQKRKT